jgi:hypothetical protein
MLRRSMSRSCRFRHAFGVLFGKCVACMGAQLRPRARAFMRISSSARDHAPGEGLSEGLSEKLAGDAMGIIYSGWTGPSEYGEGGP